MSAITSSHNIFCYHVSRQVLAVAYFLIAWMMCSSIPPYVHAQEKPSRKLEFEGYVLSDSLKYRAESIDYYFDDRKVILNEKASVSYLGRSLKSPKLTYYEEYDYLEAVSSVDSKGDYVEHPVFTDKSGEELRGTEIKFNIKTEEGFITQGKTQYDTGYYNSDIIKRVSDDTLYVANGTFTTCDKEDHPHFYFAGSHMKFIVRDKIIIRPITAYVNDIPVMWFPFYVYPMSKGRQSGFLTPRYGSSRRDGRYVSNLGYYVAPSDYWDYRTAGVLREKNGWLIKNWVNYTGKSNLSGSVFGSYEDRSDQGTKEWELQFSHMHAVSPTLSITGSGNFQSTDYSRYNSSNMYERLNRDMRSSLSVSKRWKKSGKSLSTTFSHHKNLDSKNTTVVLPSLRFRTPNKQLFGSDDKKQKRRKYMKHDDEEDDRLPKWYESIYYSYNGSFTNTDNTIGGTELVSPEEEFSREMSVSSNVTGSFKYLGWLNTEPSLQISEKFVAANKYTEDERYRRDDNISLNLRLGTKLFGTFNPAIGNLAGIRHVMTPSISYRYGKRRALYDDGADAYFRFDKDDLDKGRVNSVNLVLDNLLQMKTMSEDVEKKIDLFKLNFSTSVDFEKDENRIAPLRTSLDFKPFQRYFSTRLTATHDFYHDDGEFRLMSPYLTNVNITSRVGLQGSSLAFMRRSSSEYANSSLGRDDFDREDPFGADEESVESDSSMPVNISFTHTYQLRRSSRTSPGQYKYTKIHNIKPTVSFSPTGNFSVNYNFYYDFEKKSLNFHRLMITRDLHCWEASMSWVPSGVNEGYYFLVNIKDLPDLKIEKRRGTTHQSY